MKNNKKLGVIAGPFIDENYSWLKLLEHYGYTPIIIGTYDKKIDTSQIKMPLRRTLSINQLTAGMLKYFGAISTRIHLYQPKIPPIDINAASFYHIGFKDMIKDLDLLHTIGRVYPFTYQCLKTDKPTIIDELETIPFNPLHTGLIREKFKKLAREKASYFIAWSKKAKTVLELEGIEKDRIEIIYPGVDTDKFCPKKDIEKDIYSIDKNKINILFVGRVVWEKGILVLLFALKKLIRNGINVELIVVGNGKLYAYMINVIKKLKLEKNVKLFGNIKNTELPEVYNKCDVLCVPSISTQTWEEQFGRVFVEAMGCGKPVVSTLSGSIPEVVKDDYSGILVPPMMIDELANALEEITVNTKKREKLGKNARKWAVENFGIEAYTKKLIKVYNKVL